MINFPVFSLIDPPVYADANEAFLKITDNEDARLEHLLSEFKALFLGHELLGAGTSIERQWQHHI